jgi:hypothetical protein
VDSYDSTCPLVIDPYLAWSTYFGGSDWEGIYPFGGGGVSGEIVAANGNGNYLVAGTTRSLDFPVTPGVFQSGNGGFFDAFLVCMRHDGTRLWSTYFGGNNWDLAGTLSVDSLGPIALTGITNSTDLPTTPGAFQRKLSGSAYDQFIATFDSAGHLQWSTYFGGTGMEHNGGCHISPNGAVVVSGTTWSTDLPVTPGALQPRLRGDGDAFIARFSPTGARQWCSYLGGNGSDWGSEIVANNAGEIYTTGGTNSTDFPVTVGADQAQLGSPSPKLDYDAYLMRFDSTGRRIWGTYFGGSGYDWGYGVGVDCRGNVILGGTTKSADLRTTAKAAQKAIASKTKNDGFVAKFDSKGARIWSTYYGGRMIDYGSGVSAAPNGHAYLVGYTTSDDILKSTSNYQSALRGSGDLYLVEFNGDGMVVWDSYYGGSGVESGSGITGDGVGGIVVAGFTTSTDLPIVNGYQPVLNTAGSDSSGFYDFFVVRICNALSTRPIASGPVAFCEGDSVVLRAPVGYRGYRWIPGNEISSSITVRRSGVYYFVVEDSLGCSGTSDTISVLVKPAPIPTIERVGETWICTGDSLLLRAISPDAKSYLWSTGQTTREIYVKSAGVYSLKVFDSIGCSGVTAPETITVRQRPPRPTISAKDSLWICSGAKATFRAGGGYSSYLWSNGDTTETVDVGEGIYWVEVHTIGTPCPIRSKSVVVARAPVLSRKIIPSGPTLICQGDTLLLDAGGDMAQYIWTTGETTRIIRVAASGSYAVSLVDSNGCAAVTPPITVTVRPLPVVQAIALGSTTFCDGDSVVLDAGPGHLSYLWSTGETTQNIVVRSSDLLTVIVADFPDGCTTVSDAIQVTVHPLPTPTITLNGSTLIGGSVTIREGDTLHLEAQPGYSRYLWSTGDSSLAIAVGTEGAYGVIVMNEYGCSAASPEVAVHVIPAPHVRITLPQLQAAAGERVVVPILVEGENLDRNGITSLTADLCFDASVLLPVGGTDFGRTDGNARMVPITIPLIGAETGGGSLLQLEFMALLGDSDRTVLRLDNVAFTPGATVRSLIAPGVFSLDRTCRIGGTRRVDGSGNLALKPVRPNPATGSVEVEFSVVESGYTEIVLLDLLGQQVAKLHSGPIDPGAYVINLDIGGLPSGLYRLVLMTPTDWLTQSLRVMD